MKLPLTKSVGFVFFVLNFYLQSCGSDLFFSNNGPNVLCLTHNKSEVKIQFLIQGLILFVAFQIITESIKKWMNRKRF